MPLATPTILLGFLLLWTWGISSGLLQQSAAASPYLVRGVSPHCRPSWPWTWSSSSRPSCTHAATAPWTWGSSSRLLPLTSGCGVAPLSHASAWSVAAGTLLLRGPLHLSTTAITIRSVAERSYSPLPEVRGGGRECQASTATWVWVNSGSWWWTGRPGMLQFMGSQRVGHDWATELNWTERQFGGERRSFNKLYHNIQIPIGREVNFDPYFATCTKNNLK